MAEKCTNMITIDGVDRLCQRALYHRGDIHVSINHVWGSAYNMLPNPTIPGRAQRLLVDFQGPRCPGIYITTWRKAKHRCMLEVGHAGTHLWQGQGYPETWPSLIHAKNRTMSNEIRMGRQTLAGMRAERGLT